MKRACRNLRSRQNDLLETPAWFCDTLHPIFRTSSVSSSIKGRAGDWNHDIEISALRICCCSCLDFCFFAPLSRLHCDKVSSASLCLLLAGFVEKAGRCTSQGFFSCTSRRGFAWASKGHNTVRLSGSPRSALPARPPSWCWFLSL